MVLGIHMNILIMEKLVIVLVWLFFSCTLRLTSVLFIDRCFRGCFGCTHCNHGNSSWWEAPVAGPCQHGCCFNCAETVSSELIIILRSVFFSFCALYSFSWDFFLYPFMVWFISFANLFFFHLCRFCGVFPFFFVGCGGVLLVAIKHNCKSAYALRSHLATHVTHTKQLACLLIVYVSLSAKKLFNILSFKQLLFA